jgi:hypothetical protein
MPLTPLLATARIPLTGSPDAALSVQAPPWERGEPRDGPRRPRGRIRVAPAPGKP